MRAEHGGFPLGKLSSFKKKKKALKKKDLRKAEAIPHSTGTPVQRWEN